MLDGIEKSAVSENFIEAMSVAAKKCAILAGRTAPE